MRLHSTFIGVGLLWFAASCSGFRAASTKPPGTGGAGGIAGGSGAPGGGGGSAGTTIGGSGGSSGGRGGAPLPTIKCDNLACYQSTCRLNDCKQPACTNGKVTRILGKVFDPAGKVPLYNVDVFIPNRPLPSFTDGPSCGSCSDRFAGSPIVQATTDTAGNFTLGVMTADVPVGVDIPLVFQIGKWRREVTIPAGMVTACEDTTLADPAIMRLPANQSEGHLPKIALTTGGYDALECLLRKIGVSDPEFTPESGAGRINLFAGGTRNGTPIATMGTRTTAGANAYDASLNGGATFTNAETWWESAANLTLYDVVLHSCEGLPPNMTTNKSMTARQALQAYADAGGRVFASHWHNYWIAQGPAPWPSLANFVQNAMDPMSPFTATIDTSFPKGAALAEWLVNVGGSPTAGQLIINGAKRTVDTVNTPSQRWIYSTTPMSTQYFSFTTPATPNAAPCGKVVFSDVHVSAGTGSVTDDISQPSKPFPTGCVTTELTAQEKALEFMIFDLSAACVVEPPEG
jgi:hypothetical protein